MPGAMGGSYIRNPRVESSKGTLACVVRSRTTPQMRYILSASHVMALNGYAERGDVIQWQSQQGWREIAVLERWTKYSGGGALERCDAAIARVIDDALVDEAIADIGVPRGTSEFVYEKQRVRFRGATSGLVEDARVYSSGTVVPTLCNDFQTGNQFQLTFASQILYGKSTGEVWNYAATHGDSGALILDHDNFAIGLHIARTPDDYTQRLSVCTPIQIVLDALEVDLVSGPAETASLVAVAGSSSSSVVTSFTSGAGGSQPPFQSASITAVTGLPTLDEIGVRSFDMLGLSVRSLLEPHNIFGGAKWQLVRNGLIVDGRLEGSTGKMVTVPRVWGQFDSAIVRAAREFRVPLELIVATICTESQGDPNAFREEPGWTDDVSTPKKVSVGLMQTLISTAREALKDNSIDRARLKDPEFSIRAGTAYIDRQRTKTRLDPPVVACAYNAGDVYENTGASNRWKLRQYPIGSGKHVDRFTQFFNDCIAFLRDNPQVVPADAPSFHRLFREI